MSTNKVKKLSRQPNLGSSAPTVSNPWETNSLVEQINTVPQTWHLSTKTYTSNRPGRKSSCS